MVTAVRAGSLAARTHSRVQIRECTFDDYPQIAQLAERHGLRKESFEYWQHLWVGNPAFRRAPRGFPIGWVLEDSGTLVGYLGNIPQDYVFQGRELRAVTSRSWMVDQAYRGYATFLLDCHFRQNGIDLFVHPTLNAQAHDAYGGFGGKRVPAGVWDRSAFWITSYLGWSNRMLKAKRAPCAVPLSYAAASALFVRDKFRRKERLGQGHIQFEECAGFDEQFDEFWLELKSRNCNRLLAVRTREALDWHFRNTLAQGRACVIAARQNGRITAYAIFFRNDSRKLGLTRLRLVDFQAISDHEQSLKSALGWGLGKCRREGTHMFEIIGFCAPGSRLIEKAAPYSRQLPSWIYFYKATDSSLAKQLEDPAVWNPSGFDGDTSL